MFLLGSPTRIGTFRFLFRAHTAGEERTVSLATGSNGSYFSNGKPYSTTELKGLMPEDAKEAFGHGVRAKRSKAGAVNFEVIAAEVSDAPVE
jgi:hypothetical protein